MITDAPGKSDFFANAENLLHFAWTHVAELLISFAEIKSAEYAWEQPIEGDSESQYWNAANQGLVSAYSVVQQATEFFLKGQIADVSPYLLISGMPSSWPKGANRNDTPFSEFRTIDAQDLIRAHDVVCDSRLTDEFRTWYEDMRVDRNRIMHMVHSNLPVSPHKLVISILTCHEYFIGNQGWLASRVGYMDRTPENSIEAIRELGHEPYGRFQLHRELDGVVKLLKPAETLRYFGFDKRGKAFKCPRCTDIMSGMDFYEIDYHAEVFHPYQSSSGGFECAACGYHGDIGDKYCLYVNCGDNTIDEKYDFCIVCGSLDVVESKEEQSEL